MKLRITTLAAAAAILLSFAAARAQYVQVGPPDASGALPVINPAEPDHPLIAIPDPSGVYIVVDPQAAQPRDPFQTPQQPQAPQMPSGPGFIR